MNTWLLLYALFPVILHWVFPEGENNLFENSWRERELEAKLWEQGIMKISLLYLASFLFLTTVRGGEKKKDVKGVYVCFISNKFIGFPVCEGDFVEIPYGQKMAQSVYTTQARHKVSTKEWFQINLYSVTFCTEFLDMYQQIYEFSISFSWLFGAGIAYQYALFPPWTQSYIYEVSKLNLLTDTCQNCN